MSVTKHFDLPMPLVSEIVQVDYNPISTGHYDRSDCWHLHHFHQLDVVLEGCVELLLENHEPVTGREGDGWLIPPLLRHAVNSPQGFRQCSFKFQMTPRFWTIFGAEFSRFHFPPPLRAVMESLGQSCREPTPFLSEQIAAAIALAMAALQQQRGTADSSPTELDGFRQKLWPLLERIENRPGADWSVQHMAAECHFSTNYFSHCFRRLIGKTPQRYLQETRMRAGAARLLAFPPIPIKQVAQDSGYADVQGFSRAFNQVFKISPAAYRNAHGRRDGI